MNRRPYDIQSPEDLVAYCNAVLDEHPEAMSLKRQAQQAAALVSLFGNAHVDQWEARYRELSIILSIAGNLEWSNTSDPIEDWTRIRSLVKDLERKVS